ncbi:MAG: M28 family peptidase [Anaerolineales bacterium]|nr:MAG: M28 family peptidase [Anaerolineales bacterium]
MSRSIRCFVMILGAMLLAACMPAPEVRVEGDPPPLLFNGERALAIVTDYVYKFPYRHSGQLNNRLAAVWFSDTLSNLGWECYLDEWEFVNYSQLTHLQNAVCKLKGESPREILVVAHHDQSPATVQGADNDGSGIAILVHLAEIFAAEGQPRYTLVFTSTDAEEYGMVGTSRYLQSHPDTEMIIAGISMDNMGKYFYNWLKMEATGQFKGYGQLWLLRTAQDVARTYPDLWVPQIRPLLFQALDQAVPVSYMDQGPMVAAGIPAFGLAAEEPPEFAELDWNTYHTPEDTIELQSAEVLGQSGKVAEAIIRQLLKMDNHPRQPGPYLYFSESGFVLRGAPLWIIFAILPAIFLPASMFTGHISVDQKLKVWRPALLYFLSLWLPLVGGVLLIYLFVQLGLMLDFHLYPATTKDPAILNPRWEVVGLFLAGLSLFFALGRAGWQMVRHHLPRLNPISVKNFSLFVLGLASVYILLINPFSLLFLLPTLFWLLINERHGQARLLDWLAFALGGLMVYALIYFFGFVMQRMGFSILWFLMYMFSSGMIRFSMALAITAIIAAGFSMVIRPGK